MESTGTWIFHQCSIPYFPNNARLGTCQLLECNHFFSTHLKDQEISIVVLIMTMPCAWHLADGENAMFGLSFDITFS